ncbi:MAG: sialate O-acetylesterase [Clostridiales bacterium]|nr:sialate O-acetylesterase [Clostridiales bacterium]
MPVSLKLAPVFSDHMVLCRNKNIRIFGEAESGMQITVSIYNSSASCTAVKGKFHAVLPPMPHGGPYTMSVADGKTTLTYSDILIGDVYLAGGQSNMEMPLKDTLDGGRYTAEADHPQIRYCNYPVQPFLDEKTLEWERNTKWRAVRPGACGDISAVAFHLAVRLHAALGIPVGIIGCYLGGTSITSWLDEDALCATTGGKEYLDAFLERTKDQTDQQYQKAFHAQQRAHAAWSRKADEILANNPSAKWDDFIAELGPCPWPPPEGRKSAYRPCGLVNTMLKRIAPYTLTGFLYYQGESDYRHPHLYRVMLMSLIVSWRDIFKSPSLPFLFVQLPMFAQRDETMKNCWAILRHAQEQVYRDMRNTGLAVMIDGGDENDIHPKDKKTVGERLFEQALVVVYHQQAQNSPRPTAARPDGNAMIVTVSAPLRKQKNPWLFELAGEDMVCYQAEALIDGNEIRAVSKEVGCPVSVRYAWINYARVNVFGENGLPLAPFCLR